MKDLHTSAFSKDIEVWQQFCELFKQFERNVIIETGTYLGQSTIDLAKLAPVYTTEIRKEYQDQAKERCKDAPNPIIFLLGDSAEILQDAILKLVKNEKPIIFLDAHWYGDNILARELKVLSEFYANKEVKPVMIMHDFKVPGHPEYGWDSYNGQAFEWSVVKPYIEKLYGKDGFDHCYNRKYCNTANHKRGCLFITPKNK